MLKLIKYSVFFLSVILSQQAHTTDMFYPNNRLSQAPVLILKSIPIQHYDSKTLADLINDKKMALLSTQGAIHVDLENHRIWLHDDKKHIQIIQKLIMRLSQPQKQIIIRARIVSIDSQYLKSLGLILGAQPYQSNTSSLHALPAPASQHSLILPLTKISNKLLLDIKLSALQKQGHANIISKPELVVLNHKAATIEAGEEIPYQETTTSGATHVAFKKAVLKLKVLANINPKHHILLEISINQDKVSTLTVNGVPAIHTQHITTQVLMQNKQTLVLGGILEQTESRHTDAIPILSDIPLIGNLFKHHRRQKETKELFVFITPEIVSG